MLYTILKRLKVYRLKKEYKSKPLDLYTNGYCPPDPIIPSPTTNPNTELSGLVGARRVRGERLLGRLLSESHEPGPVLNAFLWPVSNATSAHNISNSTVFF